MSVAPSPNSHSHLVEGVARLVNRKESAAQPANRFAVKSTDGNVPVLTASVKVAVSTQPPRVVMVSFIVYVPGVVYVYEGLAPVRIDPGPSPKSQE